MQVIKARRWKHSKCCLRVVFVPASVYDLLLRDIATFNYFYRQVCCLPVLIASPIAILFFWTFYYKIAISIGPVALASYKRQERNFSLV